MLAKFRRRSTAVAADSHVPQEVVGLRPIEHPHEFPMLCGSLAVADYVLGFEDGLLTGFVGQGVGNSFSSFADWSSNCRISTSVSCLPDAAALLRNSALSLFISICLVWLIFIWTTSGSG